MKRTLLVSYTGRDPNDAVRRRRSLGNVPHVELGADHLLPRSLKVENPRTSLSVDQRVEILREGIGWLKRLPKTRVNREVLAEAFLHGSTSLWWWLESPFWFGNPLDPASPSIPQLFEQIETVRIALESGSFDRIVFVTDLRGTTQSAVQDVSEHFGLEFSGGRTHEPLRARIVEGLRPWLMRWLLLGRRHLGPRVPPRRIEVLLVSHLNALRPIGGGLGDFYLGPLREELASREVDAAVCYTNSKADASPRSRQVLPRLPQGAFLMEQAISETPAKEVSRTFGGILASWNRVAPEVARECEWRGIHLPRTLVRRLGAVVRRHAPSAVYYTAAFRELLEEWDPRIVVVTNETGYSGRAAVAACRQSGVRSVGVQHGLITKQHVEYVNDPDAMSPRTSWCCPIPDVTAVDGRYYARILTETSSYATGSVVVTGQMRYEAQLRAQRAPIARDRTRIVLATHPFDRERWTTAVLTVCSRLGPIVIKPHPLEDAGFYRDIVTRLGVKATIVEGVDIMPLLMSAGLLVTGFSTTIVEAALADCPVIVFNPTSAPEPLPFAELGGALSAGTETELAAEAERILSDDSLRDELSRRRASFLEQVAYGGGVGSARRLSHVVLGDTSVSP